MHAYDTHGLEDITLSFHSQGGRHREEKGATPPSKAHYPLERSDDEESEHPFFVGPKPVQQSDNISQFILIPDTDDDSDCEYLGKALSGLDVDGSDADDIQVVGEASNLDKTHDLPPGTVLLNSVSANGATLKRDTTIALDDGDFLLIKKIHKTPESKIFLHGLKLRRTGLLEGMLPDEVDEVAIVITMQFMYQDKPLDQCLVKIPLPDKFSVHDLICTNRSYTDCCIRNGHQRWKTDHGKLICRWKVFTKNDGAKGKISEWAIQRLSYEECTPLYRKHDRDLRREWLEGPSAPASHRQIQREPHRAAFRTNQTFDRAKKREVEEIEVIDLTRDDARRPGRRRRISYSAGSGVDNSTRVTIEPVPGKSYTFADICSGGGGSARGAVMSGLDLRFCLDHWDVAAKTLRRNFRTKVINKSIFDFHHEPNNPCYRVTILHISFPCPTYSPAHTVEGKNDDANTATGFSIRQLLEKTRPRIVTLEQTSGIVTHHPLFFRALIHQLTCMNYSVRAKILNCAEYDYSQKRKRLIVIASCPGESLPTMPEPTHGHGPGLKKPVAIADRLNELDYDTIPKNMESYNRNKKGPRYSRDQPLKHCITCDGGKSQLHPSGERGWMLAEVAMLAGFSMDHIFEGTRTEILKQIGNAFPPTVAKQLFTHIVNHLRRSDAKSPPHETVVDLT